MWLQAGIRCIGPSLTYADNKLCDKEQHEIMTGGGDI